MPTRETSVIAERDRCAQTLLAVIASGRLTAAALIAAAEMIDNARFSDPAVAAEQSRCARIVWAASSHLQGYDAAADHALAAITLGTDRRSTIVTGLLPSTDIRDT